MKLLKVEFERDSIREQKHEEPEEIGLVENEWAEIPPNHPILKHRRHTLVARVVQGKNIVVLIECSYLLQGNSTPQRAHEFRTYPSSNVVFGEDNLQEWVRRSALSETGSSYTYRFTTHYDSGVQRASRIFQHAKFLGGSLFGSGFRSKFPSLEFLRHNIPYRIGRDYLQPIDEAQEIAGIMASGNKTLDEVLKNLSSFVRESANGRAHQHPTDAWDMKQLIHEYYETGMFSGDCKSVYTFFVGLAQALGIPARGVLGVLTKKNPDDGETPLWYDHYWPEVYIPTSFNTGFWVPFDPANHNIPSSVRKQVSHSSSSFLSLAYDYHVKAELPYLPGQEPIRIQVSYE
ncbi:hypothetical protein HYU19_03410 [Candidatus Woesearchaeota archaeon]|nr:hypothetical protein [Candidatus Woesearchaeota archaeon]